MESVAQSHRIFRFGVYEADLATGDLRKHGTRIKIQEQPLQILVVLLEHPGELVTRDVLREKLWANDTFVDFDRSLNTALTKLRTALCDSADNPRFIQTVPRQGYRFIAPVSSQIVEPSPRETRPASSHPAQISVQEEVGRQSRRIRQVGIASVLALTAVILAGAWYYLHSRSSRNFAISPVSARRSVAVLAFKNLTSDSSHAWLSTALSDWLSAELAAGEQLRTIPEENVARMKVELALPEVDSLGKETLQRIRQNLGADLVVTGSYASLGKSGNEVRVDVHLQDAVSGETIGTISQLGTEDQLLDLISRTGERLRASAGIHPATPQESAAVAIVLPSNPDAARSYSEGLAKLRFYDVLGARDLFQRTITSEPNFALGHSAMSTAWSKLGYDSAAVEEGKKASELSANLPRAERLLVQARYLEVSKQWDQAIEAYRSLFEFFPDNIDYGLALAQAQISGSKGKDALQTVANLHLLPSPLGSDARIDLVEANAADSQGDLKHALASADSAIEKSRSVGASLLAADALMIRSHMLQGLGHLADAATAVNESELIYRRAGDKDKVARAEAQAAHLVDLQGDFSSAKTAYQSSLATFREIGDQEGSANELNNVGVELQNLGDLREAKKSFTEALAATSEARDQWGVAIAQANVGEILFDLGDLQGAKQMYESSLATSEAIGNKDMAAYALSGLGRVLHAQGELQAAHEAERKAVATFSAIGQIHTDANVALVDVLLDLGKNEEAAAEARKALRILDQSGVVNDQPLAEAALAKVLLAQHNRSQAQKASDAASTALGRRVTMETKLIVEIQKARVLAASDRAEDGKNAEFLFRNAIDESRRIGLLSEEFDARLGLAELEHSLGKTASAQTKLMALEKEATQRGWRSFAHKAAADLKPTGSPSF
jgi:DNA-binding winged helix-turn-helix (wHTH) protein/tetratricopeptide (TPR) repeat protein/TolB-like protein